MSDEEVKKLKEFEITITETLEKTVSIEADTKEEALGKTAEMKNHGQEL